MLLTQTGPPAASLKSGTGLHTNAARRDGTEDKEHSHGSERGYENTNDNDIIPRACFCFAQ